MAKEENKIQAKICPLWAAIYRLIIVLDPQGKRFQSKEVADCVKGNCAWWTERDSTCNMIEAIGHVLLTKIIRQVEKEYAGR